MKKHNFIKRALVALTFAIAVAVMIPAAGSVEAQAAKKVTAKINWKKAKAVNRGTTVVTVKKYKTTSDSYVKFKVPKTGTYVFTVSDIKVKGEKQSASIASGIFSIGKLHPYGVYPEPQEFKTKGGKTISGYIGTKSMYNYSKKDKPLKQWLTKRSATIKLKKGETVWLNMKLSTMKQYTYKLQIKRK